MEMDKIRVRHEANYLPAPRGCKKGLFTRLGLKLAGFGGVTGRQAQSSKTKAQEKLENTKPQKAAARVRHHPIQGATLSVRQAWAQEAQESSRKGHPTLALVIWNFL